MSGPREVRRGLVLGEDEAFGYTPWMRGHEVGRPSARREKARGLRVFARRGVSQKSHLFHGGGISYVSAAATWSTDDELDVRWYFCDAPSKAAGLRSTMGAQVEALRLGVTHLEGQCTDPDGAMVDRLDNATRASRIHRQMLRIGEPHVTVLFALFGGELAPADVRAKWGELGGVVLALEPTANRRKKALSIQELQESAQRAADAAKAAFVKARVPS